MSGGRGRAGFGLGQILCDSRAGSSELARFVIPQSRVRIITGLPTDVVFRGYGPGHSRVDIGVEHKRIDDVLKCIDSGRFAANQLAPLRDFDFSFLLVEGIFRRGSDREGGRLEIYTTPVGKSERDWYDTASLGWGSRVWRYAEVWHWLLSMTLRGGIVVLPFAASKWESGWTIGELWKDFNDKEWEEHRSHLAKDRSHIAPLRGEQSLALRAAAELGGIGPTAAQVVERKFGSWCAMSAVSIDEWRGLKVAGPRVATARGRKLGKTGEKVWAEIHDGCEHNPRPHDPKPEKGVNNEERGK